MDQDEVITIFKTQNFIEANYIKSALESENIECVLANLSTKRNITFNPLSNIGSQSISIQILGKYRDKALEIINDFLNSSEDEE
jgi:hypothetical protein